jgi:V/A-type H+-transporting ATPase subunit D
MPEIKLTKSELKRQRDNLKQYRRYLPTLQLKKQQLQIEILAQSHLFETKSHREKEMRDKITVWAGLLAGDGMDIRRWIIPKKITTSTKNIAGVDLVKFESIGFEPAEYDFFLIPLWVDSAIDALRELVSIREEMDIIKKGIDILRQELRITTQRVNLFEKVKIPEAEEAIRLIKIYIGDQMTNAVGRSKIAKRKIEAAIMEEVLV